MNSSGLEKWRLLFSNLVIAPGRNLKTVTEAELKSFEEESGIVFPVQFKEYCQVLGHGMFGYNEFMIYVPILEDWSSHLFAKQGELEACQDLYPWSQDCLDILDNGYLFGGAAGCAHFVFDLRTYDNSNQSYNIYGFECHYGFMYNFGHDFFAFVRDYCIGSRAELDCPELLIGIASDRDPADLKSKRNSFIPLPNFTY